MTTPANTSLSQWLDYIGKTHPHDIAMGLDRVRCVFKAMKLEPRAQQLVVVSGTNGKGSTIAMIEAGLLCLGKRVGSYTSPHIQAYNERVKLDARQVSDQQLVDAFSRVDQARGDTPLTYFEFGTLAAFDILFQQPLDVLLLEVGLGGRLDAVNIMDADLAIITSVALDHTDWLGDSLEAIGREKAGILRSGVLALLGEDLPLGVHEQAHALGAPVLCLHQDFGRTISSPSKSGIFLAAKENDKAQAIDYSSFPKMLLPENNILLALQALKLLCERLDGNDTQVFDFHFLRIVESLESLRLSGRLERVPGASEVYLDVGHNPHAAKYLLAFLENKKKQGKVIQAVYSSLADKDVDALVEIISPVVDCWFVAPLSDSRALTRKTLETAVGGKAKNMLSFASITEALNKALVSSSGQNVLTLVFGSFYVVEAAKAYFEDL